MMLIIAPFMFPKMEKIPQMAKMYVKVRKIAIGLKSLFMWVK